MSELTIILIICLHIIIFIGFIIYYNKQKRYETYLAKIEGPPQKYPFIGNFDLFMAKRSGNILNRFYDTVTELSQTYSNRGIFKLKLGPTHAVFIFRKDYIRDFFKINSGLEKASLTYQLFDDWLGNGILMRRNYLKWKQRRRLLMTAFHTNLVESFVNVMNEKSNILVKRMTKLSQENCFDICPLLFSCTFDVICETMLGIPMNTLLDQNLDYIKACQRLTTHFTERLYKPWFWSKTLYNLTKRGKEWKRDTEFVHKYAENVIKERKQQMLANRESNINFENNTKRLAFLELLLDIHLKDNSLTLKEIREEVDNFTFAGHDTTGCTLSWTIFLIGLHPEVQQKLHKELDSIIGKDQDITTDHIKQMTYLEAVIKESLRIYSPIPMSMRDTTEDIKLGEHIIPKGVTIYYLFANLHKDPEVFPEPDQFKPERFLGDHQNDMDLDVNSYAPFSLGVRNCIGKTYALNETKIILAKLLINFEFKSISKRSEVLPINSVVCKPGNGINICIKIRNN